MISHVALIFRTGPIREVIIEIAMYVDPIRAPYTYVISACLSRI